MRPAYS